MFYYLQMDKRALEDAENELQQWKSTARQLEIDLQSAKKLLEAEKKIICEFVSSLRLRGCSFSLTK